MTYNWEFKGKSWTIRIWITQTSFDYYASKDRPASMMGFAEMAEDAGDDPLIASIVQEFRKSASQEHFSEFDTISFALAFVQSLRYTTDKVSVGLDEYPRYPIETLVLEGGDCEDVTILGAALVTALGYGASLLLFEKNRGAGGHAALGVAGENLAGYYYEHGGTRYYYAEMTASGYDLGVQPDSVSGMTAYIDPVRPPASIQPPPSQSAPPGNSPPPSTPPASTSAGPTTTYLVRNQQVAVPAGSAYWYAFQLNRQARVDYSYQVIDASTSDVGIMRDSDRPAYLNGQTVTVWAYHRGVQWANDGATLPTGVYDLVFVCQNSVADCDFTYSLWLTG